MGEILYLHGTILDEDLCCSLADICRMCGVHAELIHEMVAEGIIVPQGNSPHNWSFTTIEIKRIQTTIRLQQDLRVNLPGCALALDLLEEIDELRNNQHSPA